MKHDLEGYCHAHGSRVCKLCKPKAKPLTSFKGKSVTMCVMKRSEGYAGQKEKMRQLRAAGVPCRRGYAPYVGMSGIEVPARSERKAKRICFGRSGS